MKIERIILHGFRATGKSTVGTYLADELGWDFFEMDDEIVRRAGMSIPDLNKNGTDWRAFRKIEHEVLSDLITRKTCVISTGGGVCVNTVPSESGTSYGLMNAEIVKNTPGSLSITLTADIELITDRIKKQEQEKTETRRPILNEQKAKELDELIRNEQDLQKRKELIINAIIEDAVTALTSRVPLYRSLSAHTFDTGIMQKEIIVNKIIQLMNR